MPLASILMASFVRSYLTMVKVHKSLDPPSASKLLFKKIEQYLEKKNSKQPTRCNTPTSTTYRTEGDTSTQCTPQDATYFQSLIGVLRWIVELDRVDICCKVSMLCSTLAMPREE